MKTNTYLGLMSLQLAGSTLQQNRLAKEQAERDRELQRITSEAAQAAQNAHYAQWRVTPEGQQFEAWKSVAAPASETILARNDIWHAVRNGSIESARANAQAGPVNDDDIRKKTRIYGIATAALWTLAILLVGIAGQSEGALTALGGVFCLAAIAATILLILNVKKGGQRRITAQSNAVAAAEQEAHARYGNSPSWHTSLTLERLHEVAHLVTDTITRGPRELPAPSTLPPLAPLYSTRPLGNFPTDLPEEARQLLEIFASEDEERLAELQKAQLR